MSDYIQELEYLALIPAESQLEHYPPDYPCKCSDSHKLQMVIEERPPPGPQIVLAHFTHCAFGTTNKMKKNAPLSFSSTRLPVLAPPAC